MFYTFLHSCVAADIQGFFELYALLFVRVSGEAIVLYAWKHWKICYNKNIKIKGKQIMALSNEDKIFISQLLDTKIKLVQLLLENDVLPRLQNIEVCYTSIYRRYANGIE